VPWRRRHEKQFIKEDGRKERRKEGKKERKKERRNKEQFKTLPAAAESNEFKLRFKQLNYLPIVVSRL